MPFPGSDLHGSDSHSRGPGARIDRENYWHRVEIEKARRRATNPSEPDSCDFTAQVDRTTEEPSSFLRRLERFFDRFW